MEIAALTGASVALSFRGISGFPLPPVPPGPPGPPPFPPPPGAYAAEVQLFGLGPTLGCLSLQLGTNFVACTSTVTATPNILQPANGQMVPVAVNISTSNGCTPGTCGIVSVSNNGVDALAGKEAVITGAFTVNLEAISGSVYTVTLNCLDGYGNLSIKSVTVSVP
jgi:hypothetical protein